MSNWPSWRYGIWRTAVHEEDTIVVCPVFVFIFRLTLVVKERSNQLKFFNNLNYYFTNKTTRKHLSFFFNNSTKYAQKGSLMKCLRWKLNVISFVVLLSISNPRCWSCCIWGIFLKDTSEHVFVIKRYIFFNQAIGYSLLCFKFICINVHSTFNFWFIVDLFMKQKFQNVSMAS